MKFELAKEYKPDIIPDKAKIKECCKNINDEASKYDYCTRSYIHENLYEIMIACGFEENSEGELK